MELGFLYIESNKHNDHLVRFGFGERVLRVMWRERERKKFIRDRVQRF